MGSIVYVNPENTQCCLTATCVDINGNLFFNVKIGNKTGWEIRYSLDSRIYKPKKDSVLPLTDNCYILKPIMKNKDIIKDKHNNTYYTITKNNSTEYKKDYYIFWDSSILENEFNLINSKGISIIGKGKRLIEDKEYISLVIEVFESGFLIISDKSKTYRLEIVNGKIMIKES